MAAPLIAIVGSADPARTYEVALRHGPLVKEACAQVGAALAARGCRLVVYSSESQFIEGDVIRGYCESGKAAARSIEVRFPQDADIGFPELTSYAEAFHLRRDTSPDWETSYYRSLASADGIVMVGGGRATLTTGLIAVSQRMPLLPVATFGGASAKVWQHLDRDGGFATAEELEAMTQDWTADSARQLVDGLVAQIDRRADAERAQDRRLAAERRAAMWSGVLAAVLLAVAGLTIPVSWNWEPGSAPLVGAVVLAPLAAGMAGSLVRVAFDVGRDWSRAALLGLGAGFVTTLLFVATQIAATPDILDDDGIRRLLFFVLPIGFIAGFTFDVVYNRLRTVDVTRTDAVTPTPPY